jgi:hypothetical protein
MEDQYEAGTVSGTSTATHGACDECGKIDVLTARVDPESPISGTVRLCPTCGETPGPFWQDDER